MARIAVIDIGSNTTRLLIADAEGDRLGQLERQSEVTRLGEGVDATGRLAATAIARVLDALDGYRRLIDRHEAERVVAVATSAVRDSANGEAFRATIRERLGFEVETITGDEEARYTFVGATTSHRRDGSPTLVIDIGGGSTEFVVGRPGEEPDFHVSTQAGSVRQTERHLHGDPPDPAEVDELREEVRAVVAAHVPASVREAVTRAIAVAGTATSLAAIEQRLDPYDPERIDGYELGVAACERMLDDLAALPLEERRALPGLNPKRAPTIVAGAAILVEAMRSFGLRRVTTSEADILDGVAIVRSR